MPSTLMLLSNPHRTDPRVLRESRALVAAGYRVTVVAWDRDSGGDSETEEEGVRIIRLGPGSPYRSPGKVFAGLVMFWAKAFRKSMGLDFDVVHCHDFDTLPLGKAIACLRRRPVLYDAHEVYSNMVKKDAARAAMALWPIEKSLSSTADEIVTVNEGMADILSRRRKAPARLVRNSPDLSAIAGVDDGETRRNYGLEGFVVSYLGSLEPGRSVEELATIFSPEDGVTVVIGGAGTLRPFVEEKAAENPCVHFIGQVGTDEALRITCASDLVPAVHDPTNPNYVMGTPIKVLEAMACGRAVITSRGIDISAVVEGAGCGFVIEYGPRQLRETIMSASRSPAKLAEMGRLGADYYRHHLSWDLSRAELLDAYRALTGPA
ncbi:MAG: glycosyltransferase family 4 protein [Methanobacteriota archaeon]|nr:MAG: glycosyltransferase family 4 protein [Euryarchaeota archaeon]